MLTRRHIRIKVLHALYAWFQGGGGDAVAAEKYLSKSIDRIHELYLYELKLLLELRFAAETVIERGLNKKLPRPEDLEPNRRFLANRFLKALADSKEFEEACERVKVRWSDHRDQIMSLFVQIRQSAAYAAYLQLEKSDLEDDKAFIRKIYEGFITRNELFHQIYEERSLDWSDDLDAAQMLVQRNLRKGGEKELETGLVLPLFKDEAEDRAFGPALFRSVLLHSDEVEVRIADKAKNWEMDRIAFVDMLLMKMAACEFEHFPLVPLKVTMNEYIELAKEYSTPKSSVFINGVLDKILIDLKAEGKVVKLGRGLLEG